MGEERDAGELWMCRRCFVGVVSVLMAAVGGEGDEETVEVTKSLICGFMRLISTRRG